MAAIRSEMWEGGSPPPVIFETSSSGSGIWPIETAIVQAASLIRVTRTFAFADGHLVNSRAGNGGRGA